ncbi:MAG: TIGR00269 family protein, partial [Nitrosopumilus sp.]
NEGIRTEIREFLNSLERNHVGIKNNMYKSILKVSKSIKELDSKERITCSNCGNECTGKLCSVCNLVSKLKGRKT